MSRFCGNPISTKLCALQSVDIWIDYFWHYSLFFKTLNMSLIFNVENNTSVAKGQSFQYILSGILDIPHAKNKVGFIYCHIKNYFKMDQIPEQKSYKFKTFRRKVS